MPLPFYMSITGSTQGNITQRVGEQEGHEDEVLCQAVEHVVQVPADAESGMPTGKRVHRPMIITKNVDRSSPLLYSAMVNNERLTRVTIKHYRIVPSGTLQNHFTVKLENAAINFIKASAPNYLDPAKEQFTYTEEVHFVYQTIIWVWEDGGIECQDEWLASP